MDKKAQLGIIEAKFLLYGLVIGIILTFTVIMLAKSGVIPLNFSFLCNLPAK